MTLSNLGPQTSQYRRATLALSLFALALFLLTGLLAVMEKAGVVAVLIEALMALLPLIVFALVGVLARTMRLTEFHWAGKNVQAGMTGMTLAACFVGGSFFPLFFALTHLPDYVSFPIVLGWASSFVLCAVLLASPLRKFGSATIPEFLGVRFQSNTLRLATAGVLVLIVLPLLSTELLIGGQVLATSLNAPASTGVLLLALTLLASVVLGGMSGAVWTQALQAVLMVFACLSPAILLGLDQLTSPALIETTGFTTTIEGSLLDQLMALIDLENTSVGWFLLSGPYAGGLWPLIATALFFAVGVASLPHLLSKYMHTETSSDSRRAAGYSLSFLLLLVVIGSAYPLLLADERLQSLLGPNALVQGSQSGLIAALVRSGIVAASLASCSALLMVLSTTLSRDVVEVLVLPRASLNQKMVLARVVVLIACTLVTYLALTDSFRILDGLAFSMSLAASAFFPVLVLSCWWNRFQAVAAYGAIFSGVGVTLLYALAVMTDSTGFWFGLPAEMGGLLGVIVSFTTGIALSYGTLSKDERSAHAVKVLHQPNGRDLTSDGPSISDNGNDEELMVLEM